MDWVMIGNATGPGQRLKAVFYLSWLRSEEDARVAGLRLAEEAPENQLCRQTIAELRTELGLRSEDLAVARISDSEVRKYLRELLAAYDQKLAASK